MDISIKESIEIIIELICVATIVPFITIALFADKILPLLERIF